MKIKKITSVLILAMFTLFSTMAFAEVPQPLGIEKGATISTQTVNDDLLKTLPFKDTRDFKNATKGFIDKGNNVIASSDKSVGNFWNR